MIVVAVGLFTPIRTNDLIYLTRFENCERTYAMSKISLTLVFHNVAVSVAVFYFTIFLFVIRLCR